MSMTSPCPSAAERHILGMLVARHALEPQALPLPTQIGTARGTPHWLGVGSQGINQDSGGW